MVNRFREIDRPLLCFLLCLAALLSVNLTLLALQSADSLPAFVSVRSAGFQFNGLDDHRQLRRNILLMFLVIAGLIFALACPPGVRTLATLAPTRRTASHTTIAAAALAFCWGAYASYPPQISYTNFRILWVDWIGTDAKIRYLGQLSRDVFYNYPHLLQGSAFLISFLSLQAVARRAGARVVTACIFSLVICISSVFVEFAGVGEDWMLVTASSLAVFWAYSSRSWSMLALSLVVLGGIRLPSSLLLIVAIIIVECARAAAAIHRRRVKWFSIITVTSVRLGALTLFFVVATYLLHLHFIRFAEGIATVGAMNLQQIAVDGFILTRFSGAYIGHALWSLPSVVAAACVTSVIFARRYVRSSSGRTALVSALAMGGSLLMYESFISNQFYYNYRYMIMALPLGLPALLHLLPRVRSGWVFAVPVLLSLLVAHPANVLSAFAGGTSAKQQMEHELYSCRRVLSPWLQQRVVYVSSPSKALANSVHYVRATHGASVDPRGVQQIKGKRVFDGTDAILLEEGERRASWVRDSGLRQVAACRGWIVLLPDRAPESKPHGR